VARGAFAAEARKKLDATTDADVIIGAATMLGYSGYGDAAAMEAGLNPRTTAIAYATRAVELDPQNEEARTLLEGLRSRDRMVSFIERFHRAPRNTWPSMVSALTDAERLEHVPWCVDSARLKAGYQEHTKHDAAAAKAARDEARKYTDDLLSLCDRMPGDPHSGKGVFTGHMALATLALHENDTAGALGQLDDAVKLPAGEKLSFGPLWQRVAVGLLKRGERESVARFFDRFAALAEDSLRKQLMTSAAAIRAGKMPAFYQSQVTPRPW
jgi:hypothetical protein